MIFWLVCTLLVVTAMAFVLPPLLRDERRSNRNDPSLEDAVATVYRDQLAEMRADLRDGAMTADEFARDREELEQRLATDLPGRSDGSRETALAGRSRWLAYVLALVIPAAAVLLYVALGTPP
jgi:cytochrome c-type biogenesis protein CcmH